MPLFLTCTNEQKIRVKATPTTEAGNPAPIDGALVGVVLSGDGTVEAGATPDEIVLVSGPGAGVTEFAISGDADLGEGVVAISDTAQLSVNLAVAAGLGLSAGAPELK